MEKVRYQICVACTNGGIPLILVENGDYNQNGERHLKHAYEGVELDMKHLEHTMPYLYELWGRTCHLKSVPRLNRTKWRIICPIYAQDDG